MRIRVRIRVRARIRVRVRVRVRIRVGFRDLRQKTSAKQKACQNHRFPEGHPACPSIYPASASVPSTSGRTK